MKALYLPPYVVFYSFNSCLRTYLKTPWLTCFPHLTHLLSATYLDCCDEVDGSFFTLTVSTCPGSFFSFGSDVHAAAPPPRWAVNCALSLRLCNLQVIRSRHKSTFYANYLLPPHKHSSEIIAQALMIYVRPDNSNRRWENLHATWPNFILEPPACFMCNGVFGYRVTKLSRYRN